MTDQAPDLRRARRPVTTTAIDRLPPHSIESEQGVLGSILLGYQECMNTCIELGVQDEWFYDLRHQTIWAKMLEMFNAQSPIDLSTLPGKLRDSDLLAQVGGLDYISVLPDKSPSAGNIGYYLSDLKDKWQARQMIKVCMAAVTSLYEPGTEDVPKQIEVIEQEVMAVNRANSVNATPPVRDLVKGAIARFEDAYNRKGTISGLSTGFWFLDSITDGLKPTEMFVLAGRPSTGKTTLGLNIAEYVAIQGKFPVGVFSLEMSGEALIERTLSSQSRVCKRDIADHSLAERDFPKLTSAAARVSSAPLHIDDSSGLTIGQLRAKARRMVQQHGVRLFVIDYLQLLHAPGKKSDNRQQEIATISGGVKEMAKELKVPVILLSQLNREMDKDKGRKPRLSDLRESGAIEQDADIIGMLYRRITGDDDADDQIEPDPLPVNLLIAKQRNGPADVDVNLLFFKKFFRFETPARVADEDIPN